MPIYEFTCGDCGEQFSEIRRVGEDKGVSCPKCNSANTRKMISSFASLSSGASAGSSSSSCSNTGGG